MTVPKCHYIKIQDKPGTGKLFVINTLRKITKVILKSNTWDITIAPTGCSAALIDCNILFRSLKIPVSSKKIYGPTSNVVISNFQQSKLWYSNWRGIFLFIIDEDIVIGRPS